jgi:hypothetical protein
MTRNRHARQHFELKVFCPYCHQPADKACGDVVYPHRTDLAHKHFWHCAPCKAYVGCHGNGWVPLGRLANAELRGWKGKAHDVFDVLWRAKWTREHCDKGMARGAAYQWLATQLGIPVEKCHIGEFDVEMCQRVIEICTPYAAKLRAAA